MLGGEGREESPQLDTDTHTWFSRGSAGSVHSPRGLLGSMLRGLGDLGFPAESRGGRRPFSSRPGDRQLFSDPSNWAVGNIPVTDSENPRGRALQNNQCPTPISCQKESKACSGRAGHAHGPDWLPGLNSGSIPQAGAGVEVGVGLSPPVPQRACQSPHCGKGEERSNKRNHLSFSLWSS